MQFPLFDVDLSTQSFSDAGISWRPSPRRDMIHVVLKPSRDLAEGLWSLPEAAHDLGPDLLHTIVQPIGDRSWITDAAIEATRRALSRVRYAPFLMLFDRIEGGNTVALCGDSQNSAAQDFRLAILDALLGHVRQLPSYSLNPHMVLNHRGGEHGRMLDQPIAWLVEEFLLIETVHGGAQHIEWGRWRLRED